MTGQVFRIISKKAARKIGQRYGKLAASQITQPNALRTGDDLVKKFVKWGHDEHILGKSFDGNVENIPTLGRALIKKPTKKAVPLVKDVDVLGLYSSAKRLGFSPAYAGERFFGVNNNPVREATDSFMVKLKGQVELKRWWNALIGKDKFGIGSFVPDNHNSIGKDAVSVLESEVGGRQIHTWYKMGSSLTKYIKRTQDAFAKAKTTSESVILFNKLIRAETAKVKADKMWKKPFEEFAERTAKKYPEARIAYFAENHPEWDWLEPLLNEREKKVGLVVRRYMQRTRKELKALGIPVLPSETGYITHLASEMPGVRNKFFLAGRRQAMKKSLDFAHRSPGSVMWFPTLNEIMEYYISASTKKLAFQPFYQRWATTRNSWLKAGQKGEVLSDWWKSWFDMNFERIGTDFEGKLGKIGNAWVRTEYMRLIGGSLSVGLKHLFKMFGSAIVHGPVATARGVLPTTKAAADLAKKAFHNANPIGPEAQLAERYIQSRLSLQAIFETPGLKRASLTVEKIAGNPTMAVEALDRGVNLFATLFAGAKTGASYEQIHRGILDYIMKINFVGGFDQFTWMKTPGRRAFFMFQMTPAKLFQFRYKLVEDAVQNLRSGGKEGRDIFGRSTGPMIVRALMMYGVAEAWARQYDMSLLDHIAHFPFTTHTGWGDTTLFQSPAVDLLYNQIQKHGFSGEGMALALRDHYDWWGTASKIKMIGTDKYPYKYKAEEGLSPATRLLLGIPSKERQERQERFSKRKKQLRDLYRLRRRQKTGTFFPEEVDEFLSDIVRD